MPGRDLFEDITAVAEAVNVLDEEPPYTTEQREACVEAAEFFKAWGEESFKLTEAERQELGVTEEEAIESAQPILAVALELSRVAAGAKPTVGREKLQDHVQQLGQAAVEAAKRMQAMASGPSHPSHGGAFEGTDDGPTTDDSGRGFY